MNTICFKNERPRFPVMDVPSKVQLFKYMVTSNDISMKKCLFRVSETEKIICSIPLVLKELCNVGCKLLLILNENKYVLPLIRLT
jgi:hypothetical protein